MLAYGTVSFSFTSLGAGDGPDVANEPSAGPVTASFLPITGQDDDLDTAGPLLLAVSEATC